TVMRSNFDGAGGSVRYGGAESTSLEEFQADFYAGRTLDRGSVSLFVNYADRSALRASDQDFTSSDDMRDIFSAYPGYETSTVPDLRSSHTPWGRFALPATTTALRPRVNGVVVATAAG